MAFKKGKRPTIVLDREQVRLFRGSLFARGYQIHDGPRTRRRGEIMAWRAPIGRGRQVHVQEVRRRDGRVAVYAHTEPEGAGIAHLVAALTDQVSYSGGAKALRSDLRADGWQI